MRNSVGRGQVVDVHSSGAIEGPAHPFSSEQKPSSIHEGGTERLPDEGGPAFTGRVGERSNSQLSNGQPTMVKRRDEVLSANGHHEEIDMTTRDPTSLSGQKDNQRPVEMNHVHMINQETDPDAEDARSLLEGFDEDWEDVDSAEMKEDMVEDDDDDWEIDEDPVE